MASFDKVTWIKFKSIEGLVYDNNWVTGMYYEYTEYENENYSKEYREEKDYKEISNDKNEYQAEDLESEEGINEDELTYLEEDIQIDDCDKKMMITMKSQQGPRYAN